MEVIHATICPTQKQEIQKLASFHEISFSEALRRLLERALKPEKRAQ